MEKNIIKKVFYPINSINKHVDEVLQWLEKKLIKIFFAILFLLSFNVSANPNLDQWLDSDKTIKI